MRFLGWFFAFLLVTSPVFSEVKTIELKNSRSGETVELEEDFLEYYTAYESRTVNEYGCLPEQVIRPVCRTLPPRTQCGPRSWCHPTPYGPVCQTRVICGPVPGGQFCENLPVTENICRNRLVNRSYPVQRSRVLYTSTASVEVSLERDFPEGRFEMSVDLTQDQLTYTGTDFGSEYALLYQTVSSRRERQGELYEKLNIQAIHAVDYLVPVTQIPVFQSSYGNRLEFNKINNPYNVPLIYELTLINRYGQMVRRVVPSGFILTNEDYTTVDYSFMVGNYFYPVRGTLTIRLASDERLLNKDQFFSRQISGDFFL